MKWYLVKLTVSNFEQDIHLLCSDPDYYIYRTQFVLVYVARDCRRMALAPNIRSGLYSAHMCIPYVRYLRCRA